MPYASLDENGLVTTSFDKNWPSINGYELPAEILSEDEHRTIYRVLIDYYGMECYMLFYYDKETGEYKITGLTSDSDNGTSAAQRNSMEFFEGDEFMVLYQYGNLYSKVEDKNGFTVTYSRDLKIENKVLSDGYYLIYLAFTDLRSDIYYSPVVVMVMENGEVVDQYIDASINAINYGEKE